MASSYRLSADAPLEDFPLAPPGRMTEEEFVAWCDEDTRAEWVDGDVVMMAPANYEHTRVNDWLASVMGSFAEHHDLGVVLSDFQVRLGTPHRRRVPDIVFITKDHMGAVASTHVEGAPDLVVEIVSPDSVARDWREKYLEYEAAGVREYWVVDPVAERVEAYALAPVSSAEGQASAAPRYRRIEEKDGVVSSAVLDGFTIRVAWLWPATRPKMLDALRQLGVLQSEP